MSEAENPRADEPEVGTESTEAKRSRPWWVELPIIIVAALLLSFMIQTFIGRIYLIPSESMEPTLHGCQGCEGDRIWVDKMVYDFNEPQVGDVLVFNGTDSWNQGYVSNRSENPVLRGVQTLGSYVGLGAPDENALVKRVMATEGQTIRCLPGDPGVMVDGVLADTSMTLQPPQNPVDELTGSDQCGGPYFGPITVPEDQLFMMGDNRTNSADSRYHIGDEFQGTIPVDQVVGKVRAILLPVGRTGGVK
ncbi:signal peptidase I [Corynebacterium ulceribovis]|uniref:signal peptidase I n=1 Tax=Corynebacterium ulceribovis TaxID=487732 RepID=UPI00037E8E7F|nr:signal peptidase I [Corynebacterium ulceribovis]